MNWTIDQKFLDKVLISKCLDQPQTKPNVALESIPDERHIVWQHQPILGPERNRKEEGNNKLKGLELIQLFRALQVKVSAGILVVILVLSDSDVFENAIHLLDEVSAEDGFAVPELLVLGQDYIVDVVRDLGDGGHCLELGGAVVYSAIGVLLGELLGAECDCLGVVHYIVCLEHVVHLLSIVDEHVGILDLGFELPHRLDHGLVDLAVAFGLHLTDVAGQVLIIPTICLLRNISRIELSYEGVVEYKPSRVLLFSICDE